MIKDKKFKIRKVDIYKVNKILKIHLRNLIFKEIAAEHRKNALSILLKADKKTVMEFLFFCHSENGNLACTCLDFAKDKNGKSIKNKSFGFHFEIIK